MSTGEHINLNNDMQLFREVLKWISLHGGSILICVWVCVYPSSISAQINDYQIRRLILYQTDCQWDSIIATLPVGQGVNYKVGCQNVSFYPDGVLVHCEDMEDERSCRINTKKKVFNLELMKQSGHE